MYNLLQARLSQDRAHTVRQRALELGQPSSTESLDPSTYAAAKSSLDGSPNAVWRDWLLEETCGLPQGLVRSHSRSACRRDEGDEDTLRERRFDGACSGSAPVLRGVSAPAAEAVERSCSGFEADEADEDCKGSEDDSEAGASDSCAPHRHPDQRMRVLSLSELSERTAMLTPNRESRAWQAGISPWDGSLPSSSEHGTALGPACAPAALASRSITRPTQSSTRRCLERAIGTPAGGSSSNLAGGATAASCNTETQASVTFHAAAARELQRSRVSHRMGGPVVTPPHARNVRMVSTAVEAGGASLANEATANGKLEACGAAVTRPSLPSLPKAVPVLPSPCTAVTAAEHAPGAAEAAASSSSSASNAPSTATASASTPSITLPPAALAASLPPTAAAGLRPSVSADGPTRCHTCGEVASATGGLVVSASAGAGGGDGGSSGSFRRARSSSALLESEGPTALLHVPGKGWRMLEPASLASRPSSQQRATVTDGGVASCPSLHTHRSSGEEGAQTAASSDAAAAHAPHSKSGVGSSQGALGSPTVDDAMLHRVSNLFKAQWTHGTGSGAGSRVKTLLDRPAKTRDLLGLGHGGAVLAAVGPPAPSQEAMAAARSDGGVEAAAHEGGVNPPVSSRARKATARSTATAPAIARPAGAACISSNPTAWPSQSSQLIDAYLNYMPVPTAAPAQPPSAAPSSAAPSALPPVPPSLHGTQQLLSGRTDAHGSVLASQQHGARLYVQSLKPPYGSLAAARPAAHLATAKLSAFYYAQIRSPEDSSTQQACVLPRAAHQQHPPQLKSAHGTLRARGGEGMAPAPSPATLGSLERHGPLPFTGGRERLHHIDVRPGARGASST